MSLFIRNYDTDIFHILQKILLLGVTVKSNSSRDASCALVLCVPTITIKNIEVCSTPAVFYSVIKHRGGNSLGISQNSIIFYRY